MESGQRDQDDLDHGVEWDGGAVDYQVVVGSSGRVDAVEAAHIRRAGFVGGLHMGSGLIDADTLDDRSLGQSPVTGPVEADVKATVAAQHYRGRSAQDDTFASSGHGKHIGLGGLADLIIVLTVRWRRQCRPSGHGVAERTEQTVNRGSTRFLGR